MEPKIDKNAKKVTLGDLLEAGSTKNTDFQKPRESIELLHGIIISKFNYLQTKLRDLI